MIRRSSLRIFLAFVAVVILYEGGIVSVMGLRHASTSDERYFMTTIRDFGSELSLAKIRNYQGVTPPLVFVVYSLWGRAAGFADESLRALSLLIVFVILVSLFLLIENVSGNAQVAFLFPLVLIANPYVAGLAVFVYTDSLMILCVLLLCLSLYRESAAGVFFSSACGLLSRQYFVFLAIPAFIWLLTRWLMRREVVQGKLTIASALSFAPLLVLFLLWQGIGPHEGTKHWPPVQTWSYDFHYFSSYVAMLGVYLSPVLAGCFRRALPDLRVLAWLIPVSLIYWIIPVSPSKLSLMVGGMDTIGFFHRLLKYSLPAEWMIHTVFWLCFCAGLVILSVVMRSAYVAIRNRSFEYPLFLDTGVIAFLLIMPWSYHVWEKYLLPLIPIVLTRFCLPLPEATCSREAPDGIASGRAT